MNIAVISLKDIFKYFIKILTVVLLIYFLSQFFIRTRHVFQKQFKINLSDRFLIICLEDQLPSFTKKDIKNEFKMDITKLLGVEVAMLNFSNLNTNNDINIDIATDNKKIEQENININREISPSPDIAIPTAAKTESVQDRNFIASYTDKYGSTCIDNQSNYDLTEDMLVPDVELKNKKDILIYHTHTCESYTPSEKYNYEMTGNYRTTDSNFNVVRVGRELTKELEEKGFNVIHNETYHDYPSYSGSYSRSLETAENILYDKDIDIVIDLHRDAMGNGDTYGPTLMVDGNRVAQLMFVIGTDGGGLSHPNWVQNLKIAIKIQETGNQMYPGLFRSMIIRNSRYNQHLAKGASIIEVGATANTMEECLLSMQCLANVLEEVCK